MIVSEKYVEKEVERQTQRLDAFMNCKKRGAIPIELVGIVFTTKLDGGNFIVGWRFDEATVEVGHTGLYDRQLYEVKYIHNPHKLLEAAENA